MLATIVNNIARFKFKFEKKRDTNTREYLIHVNQKWIQIWKRSKRIIIPYNWQ